MAKRNWRSDGKLEAEGEVEGRAFQVISYQSDRGRDYVWRILKDGKIVDTSQDVYDTVETCVNAVMLILAPDAVPVEYTEPSKEDFEALNALLYVGGLQSEITTFQDAITMYMGFQEGLPVMLAGREKMVHDLEQVTNDIKATRGAMSERVTNLIKMKEVIMVQYDILETITKRNLETLFSFIDQFLKK